VAPANRSIRAMFVLRPPTVGNIRRHLIRALVAAASRGKGSAPPNGPETDAMSDVSAAQAEALVESLRAADIRCWVVGGWGIDALVGRQTRAHHDLDLLVHLDDLPALEVWLRSQAFTRHLVWEESAVVQRAGRPYDTAFVETHTDGRELDVHAVLDSGDTAPVLATKDPWTLPVDALTGAGRIGTVDVPCASRSAQRAMHVGYDLPDKHVADLALLADLPS
jgi:lincosamide nucleotidyltransferase A/C/D/E